MRPDRVDAVSVAVARVTANTRWVFVQVRTQAGLTGVGEATLPGQDAAVATAVERLLPAAFALPDADPAGLTRPAFPALADAAAFSALDAALWDVAARRRSLPLSALLGTAARDWVPVYANINRRTLDRSPAGFAASAREALAAGHCRFKIAPFDEANLLLCADDGSSVVQPGLRRIATVRDAIGPDRPLMVDCHWRLDEPVAARVIAAAAEMGVHWVECPLPETADAIPALVRLRTQANRRGVLLAGLETAVGVEGFAPFIAAGAYNVMMPDVKYVGGLGEMLRLAAAMEQAGVAFSPHNPTGPVCHATSLHVCATTRHVQSLEMQFDETELFPALAGRDLQAVSGGLLLVPSGPGIGMDLQAEALDRCRDAGWTIGRDGHQDRYRP